MNLISVLPYITIEPLGFAQKLRWATVSIAADITMADLARPDYGFTTDHMMLGMTQRIMNDWYEGNECPSLDGQAMLEGYDMPAPTGFHPEDQHTQRQWAGTCKMLVDTGSNMPWINTVERYTTWNDKKSSKSRWIRDIGSLLDLPKTTTKALTDNAAPMTRMMTPLRRDILDTVLFDLDDVSAADVTDEEEDRLRGMYIEYLESERSKLILRAMRASSMLQLKATMMKLDSIADVLAGL